MRLNLSVLAFELKKSIPLVALCGDPGKDIMIPILYHSGMPLEGDDLYIALNSDLPDIQPKEFTGTLVSIGDVPSGWQSDNISLLITPQDLTLHELYNQIRKVFRNIHEWNESMQMICEYNGTIQELLDVSSPIFDNMLVISDEDSKVLAGSLEGRYHTAGKYVDVVHSDMTPKILAAVSKLVAPTIYHVDLGAYMDLGEATPFIILVKHLKEPSNNLDVSLVIRPSTRPVEAHDCWLIEQLAVYVKKVLLRSSTIKDHIETDTFNSLLKGESVDAERISSLYQACDFREGDRLRCLSIERPQYITEVDLGYLRQRLRAVTPNATVTSLDKCFVILINDTRSEWDKPRLREWISSWLGDRNDPIGVSNRFERLTDLREYYHEAQAAQGFAHRDSDNIMIFSDCRMDYVLSCCTVDLDQKRLFPPGLRRLLELDRSSSVDYIATLRVWLDEGMNDSQAAKKLHISRNSLLYRKDRILEILQLDVQDPEMRFFLSLCLRLLMQ